MMKNFLFSALLFFLTVLCCNAGPKLKHVKRYLNLHSLDADKKEYIFDAKFTNIGDKPLYITKIEPTCPCMTVESTVDDAVMQGDTAVVKIRFKYDSNDVGEFRKIILFYYHDSDKEKDPQERLIVLGDIVASEEEE